MHTLFILATIALGLFLVAFVIALCEEAIDFYVTRIHELDRDD